MKLTDFKVLTFDCYGTLIDWETGLLDSLLPLRRRLNRDVSNDEILETYAHHESTQQARTPSKLYSDLMATVYERIAAEWSIPVSPNECLEFGRSLKNWPAFSDSLESLTYLKQHYKLVVLSNIDNKSFTASNETLEVAFDAIYTAQDIGTYKPDPNNFRYLIKSLHQMGFKKHDILHTAQSLFHDHEPAKRIGLASCWIDRQHGKDSSRATPSPIEMPKYDFRFLSLAEMAQAHKDELGQTD